MHWVVKMSDKEDVLKDDETASMEDLGDETSKDNIDEEPTNEPTESPKESPKPEPDTDSMDVDDPKDETTRTSTRNPSGASDTDQATRRSSRAIKRKRFDDEILETAQQPPPTSTSPSPGTTAQDASEVKDEEEDDEEDVNETEQATQAKERMASGEADDAKSPLPPLSAPPIMDGKKPFGQKRGKGMGKIARSKAASTSLGK